MRLNKVLAKAGVAPSRRKADEHIERGRITVNGEEATLGMDVDPTVDEIQYRGKPIEWEKETKIIALHKPVGYVCTRNPQGEQRSVFELIPDEYQNLQTIGRLDQDTSGLILLTNDGELTQKLTHPSFEHEKEYIVTIPEELSQPERKRITKGMMIDGERTAPAKITDEQFENGRTTLHLTLHEGKKRQIRRMFEAVKHPVIHLHRIRIGKLNIEDMKERQIRVVNKKDIL